MAEIVWRDPPDRGAGAQPMLSEQYGEYLEALKGNPGVWAEVDSIQVDKAVKNKNSKYSGALQFFKSRGYDAVSRTEYRDGKTYITLFAVWPKAEQDTEE